MSRARTRCCRVAALLAAVAVLAPGCATGPRPVPDERDDAWAQLRSELEALDGWRAEGRLVVRTGREGNPASFTWIEHRNKRFKLRLSGPWGQGVARLSGGDGMAELVTADGMRYMARDAQRLLADVYGWDIPVAELRRWLIGLPGPDAEYTLDRFGRLETLDWRDWHIAYGRYRLTDEGIELPAVLTARREDGDMEVRIAAQAWQIGPTNADPPPGSPIPLMGGDR